jgi:hypothetical protein
MFALPFSVEAFQKFVEMSNIYTGDSDRSIMPWHSIVCVGKLDLHICTFLQIHLRSVPSRWRVCNIFGNINEKCLPKLRVFAWLLLKDRLDAKDLMQRKHRHIDGGADCVLCASHSLEARDHLFFNCEFASSCWGSRHVQWDTSLPISQRVFSARAAFRGPCLMEKIVCAAWNIWKEWNDHIFHNQEPILCLLESQVQEWSSSSSISS